MAERRGKFINSNRVVEGPIYPEGRPKEFTHNEWYLTGYAWVCEGCGFVRLDANPPGPEHWYCLTCRRLNRVSESEQPTVVPTNKKGKPIRRIGTGELRQIKGLND